MKLAFKVAKLYFSKQPLEKWIFCLLILFNTSRPCLVLSKSEKDAQEMKWRTQGQQCSRQRRAFEDRGCFENSGRHRTPTGRIWVHWTPQFLGADNKRRKHKWQRTECWGKHRADRRGVEKWTNRRRTKVGQEITGERAGVSREGWKGVQGRNR